MTFTNEYVTEELGVQAPLGAIAAGRLGEPRPYLTGGQADIATFVFAGRPAVNDTITVNGVTFTFIANGASPSGNQIALGASTLAQDLDAMIAALNGSAVGDVALYTYSENGVDTLTVTSDAPKLPGAHSGSVVAGVTVTTTQSGRPVKPLHSAKTANHHFIFGEAVAQAFSLPDGHEFQEITLLATGVPGGDMVVTPENMTGGTTLTFNAAGEYAILKFLNGNWVAISVSGGVVA